MMLCSFIVVYFWRKQIHEYLPPSCERKYNLTASKIWQVSNATSRQVILFSVQVLNDFSNVFTKYSNLMVLMYCLVTWSLKFSPLLWYFFIIQIFLYFLSSLFTFHYYILCSWLILPVKTKLLSSISGWGTIQGSFGSNKSTLAS